MTTLLQSIDDLKQLASEWYSTLRDDICRTFEQLEDEALGPFFSEAQAPGRFERSNWQRVDGDGQSGGGGVSAIMRGRVFEKVGVHVSVIHGAVSKDLAHLSGKVGENVPLWAAGISVIAHPWNPHAPTAHMNTRLFVSDQSWFGGCADLTPMLMSRRLQNDPDALLFHEAMRSACSAHVPEEAYQSYRKKCDDYFFLNHRQEPRGIGGIFYDYHWSGSPDQDFSFSKEVGLAFLNVYPEIMRRNMTRSWTEAERIEQETRRGRYVEFNLLQDRGTLFGLKTGGHVEAILSSLPPRVRWP